MKKRFLSIIMTIAMMFVLVLPVSAYAEYDEDYIPDARITIGSNTAWGGITGTGWCYRTWTGKPITPKVTVFDGDKELVEGRDYEKEYGNNIDMGYCRVHIYDKGDYEDKCLELEALCEEVFHSCADGLDGDEVWSDREALRAPLFVIRPLGTTLNKVIPQKKAVKVTWKRQAKKMSVKRITGYQIQFSPRKNFKRGTTKTVTVKGYKNTSKTVKKLKAKKKYYVRVRTYFQCKDGFKAYSTWSKPKTVKTK